MHVLFRESWHSIDIYKFLVSYYCHFSLRLSKNTEFLIEKNVRKSPLCIQFKMINFVSDCTTHTDCPHGGTNYVCNANSCECQIPMVLDGDKCVGMLPHKKEN